MALHFPSEICRRYLPRLPDCSSLFLCVCLQDAMLMTKERELKEAVREGRDRVSKVDDLRFAEIFLVISSQCSWGEAHANLLMFTFAFRYTSCCKKLFNSWRFCLTLSVFLFICVRLSFSSSVSACLSLYLSAYLYVFLSVIRSEKGLTLEKSALKLSTVANLRYQLSW